MKVLISAYYEFIKNLRDVKMFAILIIFPILTIYILGNSINDFLTTDTDKKIAVGYVNQDTGITGQEFDKFLDSKDIRDRLEVISFGDKSQGQKALDSGTINTLIYVPSELSQNLSKGTKQSIHVYGNKNVELIEYVVSGFTTSFNAVKAVVSSGGKPAVLLPESSIKRVYYTKNASTPSAIDYYSVLTLLQMLLLGAIFGVFIVTRSYGSDVHIRINMLPVNPGAVVLGRILGSTLYLLLAAVITMVFSKIAYNANWDGNLIVILGAFLLFSCISVGIGVLSGLFLRSFGAALMIIMLLSIFLATASGAISPASTMESISFISPNHHAKILIFGAIYGYSSDIMLGAALWLFGMITVIYGAAAVFLRRVKHDNI